MDDDSIKLENLYNIVRNQIVSPHDYEETLFIVLQFIEELMLSDPMVWAKATYEEVITESIKELLDIQYSNMYSNTCCAKGSIHQFVDEIIRTAFYLYHTFFTPKRSYTTTFVRYMPENTDRKDKYISEIKKKIEYLSSVPQPEQRTDEWYAFRHRYLTASSIWKAFSTENARNCLIYDKCKPLDTSRYKAFSTESPMHWGHKYEPVSIMWYENNFQTQISDFGCISHSTIEFIAASPDGINTSSESPRYGRMLEVKNIVNREINGIPKTEYWIQMQLQMEVCRLNECDFLETRFTEYETKEDFRNDGTFTKTNDEKCKGIILYFMKDTGPHYEYAPFMSNEENYTIWENKIMKRHANLTWMKTIYWKLQEVSCVLVLRNKTWFKGALPVLREFWDIIQKEKQNGWEHRAPKRKQKNYESPSQKPSQCLIDVETLVLDNTTNTNKIIPGKVDIPSAHDHTESTKIINIKTESLKRAFQSQNCSDS